MISVGFRHIREALQSITRNFVRSSVAMLTVGLTLLLVGLFSTVLLNASKIASDSTGSLEVRVYVDAAATQEDTMNLQQQIQTINGVENVVFSDKAEQLAIIVQRIPQFSLFEEDNNPLYDAFIVTISNSEQLESVTEQIRGLNYVYRVNDGGEIASRLVQISRGIQFWGSILIVVLVLIAIVLIMNTIRATIISRQTEIEIMRLVGATKWFIRWPFLLEGAFIGFLGSILPVVLIYMGYHYIYQVAAVQLAGTQYSLLPADPFAWYIAGALALLGILLGSLGSIVSIRRFLKK